MRASEVNDNAQTGRARGIHPVGNGPVASGVRDSGPTDPLDHAEALMCWDGARWVTWAQWRQAQVDRIMPPRPKQQWARRTQAASPASDERAEYRRKLLDARHG